MALLGDIEAGAPCVHKNTRLRYSVVDVGDGEVLLSPESAEMQDLVVPVDLFRQEFVIGDRYSAPRGRRGRRSSGPSQVPTGPKVRGKIKKMVRDRGFGFIRGDDGKEVFFHRSGLQSTDYDALSEGDSVEYVVQEGPRGARAENVRAASDEAA